MSIVPRAREQARYILLWGTAANGRRNTARTTVELDITCYDTAF